MLTLLDPQDHGREFCLGVVLEEDKYKGGQPDGGVPAASGGALSATGRHHKQQGFLHIVRPSPPAPAFSI